MFGDWQVHPRQNQIRSLTKPRRIRKFEPKPMQVLLALAGKNGALITREELLEIAWPGRTVSDESISVAIRQLRKLLDDDAQTPRYIQTVPGYGYRLVAKVKFEKVTARKLPLFTWSPKALIPLGIAAMLILVFILPSLDSSTDDGQLQAGSSGTLASFGLNALSSQERDNFLDARFRVYTHNVYTVGTALTVLEELEAKHAGIPEIMIAIADGKIRLFEAGLSNVTELLGAMDTAETALRARPDLASAQSAFGQALFLAQLDIEGAEHHFRAAIDLDPTNALARRRYAILLARQGRSAEAVEAIDQLRLAEPQAAISTDLANIYYIAGRYEDAITEIDRLISISEEGKILASLLVRCYQALGRGDDAFNEFISIMETTPYAPDILPVLRANYAQMGSRALYVFLLERNEQARELNRPGSASRLAIYAAGAGDIDKALYYLKLAVYERDASLLGLDRVPEFGAYLDNSELQGLLGQIQAMFKPGDDQKV